MSLIRCQLLVTVTLAALLWTLSPSACLAATPAAVTIENDVLHFSYELENWLDRDKNVCEDFFGYVCGRSLNTTLAQQEQRRQWEQQNFDKFLSADNDEQLMDAELKLKQFYESCHKARSVEDLKSSHLYRMSGSWPAIDDSAAMIRKRRDMNWMSVLSAFHDVGVQYIFQTRIEIKSNKRIVHLQPSDIMHYTLRKFEQLAGEVMQEYAVDVGRARLVALEILSFERNRREIVKSAVIDEVLEFNYTDFKTSLFGNAFEIDWDAYFKKIVGKALKPNDTMLVRQLPKVVQMFELLQNTTITRLLNWIWIDYLMDKSSNDCQTLVQHYFEPVYQNIVARSLIDKVQMAQMYADLGRAYEELLPTTPWIDEMSQQNSKLFLGRIMHLTLNGDSKLDADYNELTVTKRNFYRNLEKVQRFRAQQQQNERTGARIASNTVDVMQAATEFFKVFRIINTLLHQQNLTTPLNYALVGERFTEHMIAAGGSSSTPGAWRSMDSEREFATLRECIARQTNATTVKYNLNDLLLKMLAQHQTLHALEQWQQKNATLLRRLDSLLAAGRLKLSLRKLYFIGSTLADCRQYAGSVLEERQLVQSYLRNSQQFTQTFGCRAGEELYARNVCKVL